MNTAAATSRGIVRASLFDVLIATTSEPNCPIVTTRVHHGIGSLVTIARTRFATQQAAEIAGTLQSLPSSRFCNPPTTTNRMPTTAIESASIWWRTGKRSLLHRSNANAMYAVQTAPSHTHPNIPMANVQAIGSRRPREMIMTHRTTAKMGS